MKLFFSPLVSMFFIFSTFMHPTEKQSVQSVLKTATVYRNGALLTHNASASLEAGDNELVIEGLSSYLDINSIKITCPAAVTIIGTEFSNNYLTPENISPGVKAMKESVQSLADSMQLIEQQISTDNGLLEILETNRDLKGTQTGVSVSELAKLMIYYKLQSLDVKNELLALNKKKNRLYTQQVKINQQITEEQSKNTVAGGRLILQLNAATGGKSDFSISYITQNAYWTPYYDIRADNIKSPLQFIYKAKIAQTTGIDWKKVKLSLSTSTPAEFSNAPIFQTWFLGYIDPVRVMEKDVAAYNSVTVVTTGLGVRRQPRELGYASSTLTNKEITAGRSVGVSQAMNGKVSGVSISTIEPLYFVNGSQMSAYDFNRISKDNIKTTQVLTGATAANIYGPAAIGGATVVTLKDGLEDFITISDNDLDMTYDIDLPYDVPTTGKPQIAELVTTKIPATYTYYTAPRLNKQAFLMAQIADWHTLNLLPGQANIIFEGTYIGQSFIDPSSTGDTLSLTMGTDKRVVVSREKVKDFSSTKISGNNTLQTLTYELTVKNNKKEAIDIILKDQYPKSTLKEIDVKLIESVEGTANDELGVVTWRLHIEPGQNKKLRISYSVKYPKDKLVNLN